MKFSDLFHINDIIRERDALAESNKKQMQINESLRVENSQLRLRGDESQAKFEDAREKYNTLLARYREQKAVLTPEMQDAMQSKKIIEQLRNDVTTLQNQKGILLQILDDINSTIANRRNELVEVEDNILYQSFGLYTPRYDLAKADDYKVRLVEIREKQKQMIKDKTAVTGKTGWVVNGSEAQGRKMVSDMQKLLLRAFNNECDDIISNVTYANIDMSEKKIVSASDNISKLGTVVGVAINKEYLTSKIEELYLAFEYQEKKQEEKELKKELLQQMKEAEKVQREIDAARKKIEKDQHHFENALSAIEKKIENATDEQKADLEAKKVELEVQLEKVEESLKEVDYREANAKAGYVYIISNIGSFGENVFKIGMTRRLEPQERVDELGSASVPFRFDTHALIFSDDAPVLEAAIHKALRHKRLNLVNNRKEFFMTDLDEIKKIVKENFDKTVEFIDVPAAEQYRLSLKMREAGEVD
jgi:predicted  nucleic acid-binding Zn-ribbon protein